jgi:DeoR/GlpR family transcriptional regulator of sugar metabolism
VSTVPRLGKRDRHERILAELRASATLRASDLALALGVSTETIRRDLAELGAGGLIARTYGGAAARPFAFEPSVSRRHALLVEERTRIAELAAGLIEPGQVVMIDAGSTTLHFARRLVARGRDLTVVTNCLGVARALGAGPGITVLVCPGRYDAREGSLCGPDAVAHLRRFNANWAVIGASGLTPDGPSEVLPDSAAIKRVMLQRAERSLLLVDHTKYGRLALEVVCPLARIRHLVSDAPPTGELADELARAGVDVRIA